jgi:hypothetical protein
MAEFSTKELKEQLWEMKHTKGKLSDPEVALITKICNQAITEAKWSNKSIIQDIYDNIIPNGHDLNVLARQAIQASKFTF